jgi:metal-dependent amidase/aminoacylase/carboxypeptidase family protein
LIEQYEATDAVYNDPALAKELRGSLEAALGKDNVVTAKAIMGSEDFSYFIAERISSFYFALNGNSLPICKKENHGIYMVVIQNSFTHSKSKF